MPITFIGSALAQDDASPYDLRIEALSRLFASHDFDSILLPSAILPGAAGRRADAAPGAHFLAEQPSDVALPLDDGGHVAFFSRIGSDGAVDGKAADLLLVPPGTLRQVTQSVRAARRAAAYQGSYPGFLVSVTPVLGATQAAAEQRAKDVAVDPDSIALIGTPEKIAGALMDYYDIGIEHILLRGGDPLGDVVEFGRDLLPLMRRRVALRDGMLAMLAG